MPQLIENYKCGSAEAISLTFLGVWFVGDVTNLSGAAWAQLVPTIIAIAVYFCIADGVMIAQCVYYNVKNARKVARKASLLRDDGVEEPLLGAQRRTSTENMGLPGSRRRSSAVADSRRSSHRSQDGVLGKILEEQSGSRESLKNAVSVLAICAIGAAGWTIAWQSGAWKPTTETKDGEGEPMPVGAEVLGYLSAVCYLGARIPQIIKNYRDKSCEGECRDLVLMLHIADKSRAITSLLHTVATGKCDIRSRDPISFHGKGVLHSKSTLAHRIFGHYGRRRRDFCTVPHLLETSRGKFCGHLS